MSQNATVSSQSLSIAPQAMILLLKSEFTVPGDRRRSGSLYRTSWAALDCIHYSKARGRSAWACSSHLATFRAWRRPGKKVKIKSNRQNTSTSKSSSAITSNSQFSFQIISCPNLFLCVVLPGRLLTNESFGSCFMTTRLHATFENGLVYLELLCYSIGSCESHIDSLGGPHPYFFDFPL